VANHKQAEKRARQSESGRQRNLHVKSTVRTYVKRVRYAVETIEALDAGRNVHPQEVEKHVRGIIEKHANEYQHIKQEAVLTSAAALLASAGTGKKFDRVVHRAFLQGLAKADLLIATKAMTKAASKGVYHKRNVSRRVSRLNLLVNGILR
jgi:ribosomal protein S20